MFGLGRYQYEGNLHLIYAIVRRKKLFEDLAQLKAPVPKKDAAAGGDAAVAAATPPPASAGWAPTDQWIQSWKSKLPLDPILRVLHYLEPQAWRAVGAWVFGTQQWGWFRSSE